MICHIYINHEWKYRRVNYKWSRCYTVFKLEDEKRFSKREKRKKGMNNLGLKLAKCHLLESFHFVEEEVGKLKACFQRRWRWETEEWMSSQRERFQNAIFMASVWMDDWIDDGEWMAVIAGDRRESDRSRDQNFEYWCCSRETSGHVAVISRV